jgi:hypothetical protein
LTGRGRPHIVGALKKGTMNFKLLFKSILILAVLALLVIMGINNTQAITLVMKPIMPRTLTLQAGYMYFGFFGVGFLVGALMMAGGGGGKKSASKPPEKK